MAVSGGWFRKSDGRRRKNYSVFFPRIILYLLHLTIFSMIRKGTIFFDVLDQVET